MERFLYRLSQSPHADKFILKGALMLRAWRSPQFRPTMNIDVLGKTSNQESSIIAQIRDIISVPVVPDGLVFDPASIQAERITTCPQSAICNLQSAISPPIPPAEPSLSPRSRPQW
jgi:hypothetical protein